jgi:hypothetical protein
MAYVIDRRSTLAITDKAGNIEREFSPLLELVLSEATFLSHQECVTCGRPCCPESVFMFRLGDEHVLLARGGDVFKDPAADSPQARRARYG